MNTREILQTTDHRPFPLPSGPWIMTQIWHDLLFAHWPVAPQMLRRLIPSAFPLDTFEEQCWVGVVPFDMTHVCPRGFPPLPLLTQSVELNVRTYVVVNGIPGVYFFSLDADNLIAVMFARMFFHLPYFYARMESKRKGDIIHYKSQRRHRGAPPAAFRAEYRPVSPVYQAERGTIDSWLTERYCLYTLGKHNEVLRANIHHRPWPLQAAELEVRHNSMASSHGIILPDTAPLLHFAKRQEVLVWPLSRVPFELH
jgi:uncharacterized protein YqjF (DUF2071 family)